ncbi:MAG TPA: tRNA 2-thiouridine(34) synthase MnmA [Thermoleophilaceae bacterium]|nr:tRNA 2-thiouridine(34) synthase MnmA [Thermoleophilaceae bacterium]
MRSFAEHLSAPAGQGALRDHPHSGAAGGAACGDVVRIAVRIDGDRVVEAGFDAEGCGALTAAASAVVESIEGGTFLDACLIGAAEISNALGGLTPPKRHVAELAADALHRALGAAAKDAAVANTHDARRTLVAMSGGVDSAAAAQLALDAGDQVVAVTLDLRERFRAEVVERFLDGYAAGRTPNPCVRCNGEVRFDAMLDLAEALGAAKLATGHYARIARDEHGPLVREAADPAKDQSYMLAKLDPALLDRLSFPLGGLTKDAVRALAREAGLPVADKRESQDLCFVAGLGGRAFLQRHGGPRLRRPGPIVDRDGRVLGRHEGHHNYTVGQRRGLGVAAPEPVYVLEKDAATNTVVVGSKDELATTRVPLDEVTLHRDPGQVETVRLRYHAHPIACRVLVRKNGGMEVELERAAHAVAPGQLACLMSQDRVVGEGTIGEPR